MQLTGAGMGYAALLYFLSYNMARPDAFQIIGGIVLAACAGIIVAQPFWVKLSAREWGKSTATSLPPYYMREPMSYGVSVQDGGRGRRMSLSFIAALGNSGWAMLGFSMMSDVAAEDTRNARGCIPPHGLRVIRLPLPLVGRCSSGLILSALWI